MVYNRRSFRLFFYTNNNNLKKNQEGFYAFNTKLFPFCTPMLPKYIFAPSIFCMYLVTTMTNTMLREAFKKEKKTNFTFWGGSRGSKCYITLSKVVFKIHFKPFWVILEKQALRKFSEAAQVKFLSERFKKYSMLPNELMTFKTTNF